MGTKKARSSAAAETVARNIDMLWEILIRVPLKPLVQLKCVSKQWKALISDQQFRDSHSQQHQRCLPNSLIFSMDEMGDRPWVPSRILSINTTTTPAPRVFNLDFLNQSKVNVVRSCNGLLLCCRGRNCDCDPTIYFICNPITRDFTTLNLRRHPFRGKIISLYLAFNPSISPRYKVISISCVNGMLDWVLHVYTFKTRSRIGPGVSFSFELDVGEIANGVYCNGAIHWRSQGEFSVYFNVDTQRVKNYPMPPLSSSEWSNLRNSCVDYFGELGGRLHMIVSIHETGSYVWNLYDIFELKEDYSGWSLRHRIDLRPIRVKFPHINWDWHHVSFFIFGTAAKDKEKKSSMSVLIVGKEGAICHDPVDKTSTKLCDFEKGTAASRDIEYSLPGWYGYGVHQHFEYLC